MHELSLATQMMQIVEQQMLQHPQRKLTAIELDVGRLSGVEINTFTTAIEAVVRSSAHSQAKVEINLLEATAQCINCGERFSATSYLDLECPRCGSGACGVVGGDELRIKALRMV